MNYTLIKVKKINEKIQQLADEIPLFKKGIKNSKDADFAYQLLEFACEKDNTLLINIVGTMLDNYESTLTEVKEFEKRIEKMKVQENIAKACKVAGNFKKFSAKKISGK